MKRRMDENDMKMDSLNAKAMNALLENFRQIQVCHEKGTRQDNIWRRTWW